MNEPEACESDNTAAEVTEPVFKKYAKANAVEMRPYVENEALPVGITISATDVENGSPKVGDMIVRNPENHDDKWLISEDYFTANYTEV